MFFPCFQKIGTGLAGDGAGWFSFERNINKGNSFIIIGIANPPPYFSGLCIEITGLHKNKEQQNKSNDVR